MHLTSSLWPLSLCVIVAACARPVLPGTSAPVALAEPATPQELSGLANRSNAFALDFYGKVRAQEGNLVFSPFTISAALTMTWAGARGATAVEMGKVLHLEGSVDRTLELEGAVIAGYSAPDQTVTVRAANRLFGDETTSFERPYLDRLKGAFGASLDPLDFVGDSERSRSRINAWVANETSNRIKDLLPRDAIDGSTRLVLVNAIYFLGDWQAPFETESTHAAPFLTGKAEERLAQTMHETASFAFVSADGVKVLELPYKDSSLAMDFVLPDAIDGLTAVEARLTPAVLDAWMVALAPTRVTVSLPRVELDPARSLSLADTLSSMGMPLAFDREQADFEGIGKPRRANERLFISKVFHKAFIKLDEKGTEAAAATAVVMAGVIAGMPRPEPPPQVFKADHPFLCLLRDVHTGLILFMGRVSDPTAR